MKHSLITGASGGIGSAIAKKLAAPNHALSLQYYRNREQAERTARACEKQGAEVVLIQANLAEPNGAQQVIHQIEAPVDVCIHNAGISESTLFTEVSDVHLNEMLNTLLNNPLKITRALLPNMIQKRNGKVLVISSIWGLTGASCEVVYSTAKGGLNTFVKALAKEVAPSGIQVNAIAPGLIETDMLDEYTPVELELLKEEIPAGRLGQPKEIADAAAFLCSDKADYITGQILSINGAWYC